MTTLSVFKEIAIIHESLVNGQRKQMVKQIDEYEDFYNVWADYAQYLNESYASQDMGYHYFKDAVISYHRIKSR